MHFIKRPCLFYFLKALQSTLSPSCSVVAAHKGQNNMARFSLMLTSELESLEENATNSNTKRSTCTWLNVFRAWASWRQFDRLAPEEYAVSELEEKLCLFFAEIKRQDGKDYEPDSLAVMQAAIDRHLNLKGYSKSIQKDREFSRSRLILEWKARRLRMEG